MAYAATGCGFNVDGLTAVDPNSLISRDFTSDGLLILRARQNRVGSALIAGTRVDQTLVNQTAVVSAIDAHVSTYRAAHDMDASGDTDIKDAIIIARYLAGFRGAHLTQGLTLTGTRKLGTDIETYIASGCPTAPTSLVCSLSGVTSLNVGESGAVSASCTVNGSVATGVTFKWTPSSILSVASGCGASSSTCTVTANNGGNATVGLVATHAGYTDSNATQNVVVRGRNVMAYGARGDGVADDSAAIQAAIDAAPSGEIVFLPAPSHFYKISQTINITQPLTLVGADSLIKNLTDPCPTFIRIEANDVQVRRLHLIGSQQTCGYAVSAGGESAPISNLMIEDNQIENFYNGVSLTKVDGFRVTGNRLSDLNYYAIQGSAVNNGVIDRNTIRGVSGAGSGNAYGIVMSRNAQSPANLRSTDVLISNNNVQDVPVWECYDTHGGQRIRFIDNYCKNAMLGINVAFSGGGQDDPDALAPLDCEIRGNTIEKSPTEPYRDAIVFAGTHTRTATGSITDNVLIGFGPTGIYTVNANVIQANNTRR